MLFDGYCVCQRCFDPTSGSLAWEGRTYCEDCYPLVVPNENVNDNLSAAELSSDLSVPSYVDGARSLPSLASMRADARVRRRNQARDQVGMQPPMPPRNSQQSRVNPVTLASPSNGPSSRGRLLQIKHRNRIINFHGLQLACVESKGPNRLWLAETRRPDASDITDILGFRLADGVYLLASRVILSGEPTRSIAFRFTTRSLIQFFSDVERRASLEERNTWIIVRTLMGCP
jgi:hypothetical protein